MKTKLLLLTLLYSFLLGKTNAQNALHFDGSNDVVQTTYPGVLGTADRTFEAWVFVDLFAPLSNLTILDYGVNAPGSRNTFMVDGNRDLRYLSGGTNANLTATGTTITPNNWIHVAFVLDSGIGFMYINGVQVSTGSLSSVDTPANNEDMTIGQRVAGGSIPFQGAIDEIRIWDVARSQAEIVSTMNIELCTPMPGLAAYFNFNEGVAGGNNSTVTTLTNAVGSGNGTLSNFALSGASSNFISSGANVNPVSFDTTVTQVGLLLTANDSLSDSYQWYDCRNDTLLTGETGRSLTVTVNGDYKVFLSKQGCIDSSACISVIGVGLDEIDLNNPFRLSQNPVAERFDLINLNRVSVNISLRSVTGELIEYKRNVSQERIQFDMTQASSGIYLLSVEGEKNQIQHFKLIKN